MSVIACDWSRGMIAEARRRALDAKLPARFAVADLMQDLPYAENAFDYLYLSGYGYLFPGWRRVRFLRQGYLVLKPGGVFIIAFPPGREDAGGTSGLQGWAFFDV